MTDMKFFLDLESAQDLVRHFDERFQYFPDSEKVIKLCEILTHSKDTYRKDAPFLEMIARLHEKLATLVNMDFDESQERIDEPDEGLVENGKSLLEYLGGGGDSIWNAFIESLDQQRAVKVLRQLLRASYQSFKVSKTPGAEAVIRGLKVVLKSTSIMDTLALVLTNEVEMSANEAPSFLCSTDVGRLLSLSTLPSLKAEPQEVILDHGLMDEFRQIDLESTETLETVSEHRQKFVNYMSASFEQLLTSEKGPHRQAAFRWAWTILDRNKARRNPQNAISGEMESVCCGGYLINICRLLLLCHRNLINVAPLPPQDSSSFACYFLDIDEEICSRLGSQAVGVKGVVILCRNAIKVAIIPALHRLHRAVLDQLNNPRGAYAHDGGVFANAILHLYHKALWDAPLSEQVVRFFTDQLRIMNHLQKFEGALLKAKSKEITCYLVDIADWLACCCEHHIHKDWKADFNMPVDKFVAACANLLQSDDSLRHLQLAFKLAPALHCLFGFEKTRETLRKSLLVNGLPQLTAILVDTYVKALSVSTVYGGMGFADAHSTRHAINELLLTILDDVDCKDTMGEQVKEHFSQEFLGAMLDESAYLNLSKMDVLRPSISNTFTTFSPPSPRINDASLNQRTEGKNLEKMIHSNLRLMSRLVEYDRSGDKFSRSPISYQLASLVCHLLGVFSSTTNTLGHDAPGDIVALLINIVSKISHMEPVRSEVLLTYIGSDPKFNPPCFRHCANYWVERENVPGSSDHAKRLTRQLNQVHKESENAVSTSVSNFLEPSYDEQNLINDYTIMYRKYRVSLANLVESHHFKAIIEMSPVKTDAFSATMNYLEKELDHLDPPIFIVRDEIRLDVLRCAAVGPCGTPCSRGLFVFDVFLPPQYPEVPPLVHFLTTGCGTADFSSKLGRDGRVHLKPRIQPRVPLDDDDNSAPADPICEVLIAIPKLFPKMPTANSAAAGFQSEEQRKRTSEIQDMTLRHAMVGLLRNPPPGLEEIVKRHFTLQKQAILKQCASWIQDSTDDRITKVLKWDAKTLCQELEKLD